MTQPAEKGTGPICPKGPQGAAHKSDLSPLPDALPELAQLLGQLADEQLSPAGQARLQELLRDDPAARTYYLDYMELHARLQWKQLSEEGSGGTVQGPIIIDTGPTIHYPLFTTQSPLGGWLFSYAAATVIMCVAILGAWAYKVSLSRAEVAKVVPRPASQRAEPEAEPVGRITGKVECRWANPQDAPPAAVPLGRRYELASGLLEISYQSGAKVILQGPCSYEVDSSAGGFLSHGKLTARVETKGEGGSGKAEEAEDPNSEIRNPKSPFLLPPSPFVVRTPTAVITDLGTEFGVEVSKQGTTTSHVFQGTVRVRLTAGDGPGQEVLLHKNESARAERDGDGSSRLLPSGAVGAPPCFVRWLVEPPKRLDLLDIVAGGNGLGHEREHGIDPTTGMQDPMFLAEPRQSDRRYHPVTWHRLIDGVFIPQSGAGAVQLDSAGHTFDGFPHAAGTSYGPIWARAAEARPKDEAFLDPGHWIYSISLAKQPVPEGRGLLGCHANVGVTFNLAAIREMHRGVRPARFRAVVGLADAHHIFPEHRNGLADVWVFVDGRLQFQRLQLAPEQGAVEVNVALGPDDRFLTLVTTNGREEPDWDWVVFGGPVLDMASTESDSANDRPQGKEVVKRQVSGN
jgi:hypothetical protein